MSFRFRWELSPQDIERADHYAVEGYKNAEKMGARGELAFCRFMNLEWNNFSFKDRKTGDVSGIEVRTTAFPNGCLLLRPRDRDDRIYVNVLATNHPIYEFTGWIWGRQGKRPEWERDKDHPISSVFFVPPTVLKPIYPLIWFIHEMR